MIPPRAIGFIARCAVLSAVAATALGATAPPSAQIGGRYYTIETTALQYNVGTGLFATSSPVRITRDGLDARADRAHGNTKAGTAQLEGNVRVHDAGGAQSAQGKNAPPATLTCDRLDVDAKQDLYHASGRARYESATRSASAETMLLDRKHKRLRLEGNVTVAEGDTAVNASVVDVDLASGETTSVGSPLTITQQASPTPAASPR